MAAIYGFFWGVQIDHGIEPVDHKPFMESMGTVLIWLLVWFACVFRRCDVSASRGVAPVGAEFGEFQLARWAVGSDLRRSVVAPSLADYLGAGGFCGFGRGVKRDLGRNALAKEY